MSSHGVWTPGEAIFRTIMKCNYNLTSRGAHMFEAHAVALGPLGRLAINIAMLSLIGWALWRAEQ